MVTIRIVTGERSFPKNFPNRAPGKSMPGELDMI